MAARALIDSSFFIDRLRAGDDPLEELAPFADDWDILTCGVVRTEVLRGLKHKNALRHMREAMDCMLYIPTTNSVWERVEGLAWDLDRAGKVMQITDLIIAASALEADAVVITLDSDFRRVPGLQIAPKLE
jgi:predicted nucleic acid-binding protein